MATRRKCRKNYGYKRRDVYKRQVLTIEGRKNGKTTECSAINIDMCANDHEGSPECYNIATAKDQANKGFEETHKMIRQSPLLRKHFRKRQGDLYFAHNMGIIKALASNTNSLDGLNSHCAVSYTHLTQNSLCGY